MERHQPLLFALLLAVLCFTAQPLHAQEGESEENSVRTLAEPVEAAQTNESLVNDGIAGTRQFRTVQSFLSHLIARSIDPEEPIIVMAHSAHKPVVYEQTFMKAPLDKRRRLKRFTWIIDRAMSRLQPRINRAQPGPRRLIYMPSDRMSLLPSMETIRSGTMYPHYDLTRPYVPHFIHLVLHNGDLDPIAMDNITTLRDQLYERGYLGSGDQFLLVSPSEHFVDLQTARHRRQLVSMQIANFFLATGQVLERAAVSPLRIASRWIQGQRDDLKRRMLFLHRELRGQELFNVMNGRDLLREDHPSYRITRAQFIELIRFHLRVQRSMRAQEAQALMVPGSDVFKAKEFGQTLRAVVEGVLTGPNGLELAEAAVEHFAQALPAPPEARHSASRVGHYLDRLRHGADNTKVWLSQYRRGVLFANTIQEASEGHELFREPLTKGDFQKTEQTALGLAEALVALRQPVFSQFNTMTGNSARFLAGLAEYDYVQGLFIRGR